MNLNKISEENIMKKNKLSLQDINLGCNITGLLMFIGCIADVYFTYHFEWDAWLFGAVFTGIMVPGKAAKVLGDYVGKKKK